MEKALCRLRKQPERRLKAVWTVWMGLMQGSTRTKMIEDVKRCGYRQEYAEKLVDTLVGKGKGMFNQCPVFTIESRSESRLGKWSKPGSRQTKLGRPPAKYRFVKLSELKQNEKLEDCIFLVTLLSGSCVRLIKLILKMMREEPRLKELAVEAISKMSGMPTNITQEFYEATINEDLEKRIDEWYSKLIEPVWRELPKVLEVNQPVKGDPREMLSFL
ncbi:MAG: hypothetical protein ACPLZY_02755 [Candidatus Norongarragalinales archaeon]